MNVMIIVMMGYIRLEYHIVDVVNGHIVLVVERDMLGIVLLVK